VVGNGSATGGTVAQQNSDRGKGTLAKCSVTLDILQNKAGRVVGRIVREGDDVALVKGNLDPSRHMLQRPPGWATDREHLQILESWGGTSVRLHTVGGTTYRAPLQAFRDHGVMVDRGHGEQVVLVTRFWDVDEPEVRQLRLDLGGAT
jgi:hypothetical protein